MPPAPALGYLAGEASGDDLLIEEQKKEREEDASGLDVLANDSPLVNRINKIVQECAAQGFVDTFLTTVDLMG